MIIQKLFSVEMSLGFQLLKVDTNLLRTQENVISRNGLQCPHRLSV